MHATSYKTVPSSARLHPILPTMHWRWPKLAGFYAIVVYSICFTLFKTKTSSKYFNYKQRKNCAALRHSNLSAPPSRISIFSVRTMSILEVVHISVVDSSCLGNSAFLVVFGRILFSRESFATFILQRVSLGRIFTGTSKAAVVWTKQ